MRDLAASVDAQRINSISEEEPEQQSTKLDGTKKIGVEDRRSARGELAARRTKRGNAHSRGRPTNAKLEGSNAPMPASSQRSS